jgi:hypothetical protein
MYKQVERRRPDFPARPVCGSLRRAARVEAAARADLTSTASLHSPRPCEARMGLASDAAVMLWTSAVFENRG